MNRQARLQALSDFLRSRRMALDPGANGFPTGGRRRTPGLRREEVAQLAGVSPTWYTWLEQGRDIRVSASVQEAVAKALGLNADERKYLAALAGDGAAPPSGIGWEDGEAPAQPSLALQLIVDGLDSCPAIISDRRCRIAGWNEAAARVFLDFGMLPPEQRNMITLLFTRPELQRLAVNWEQFVRGYLAIFRSYYGQYADDDWYVSYIEDMEQRYPRFRELWEESRVSTAPEVILEFRHAKAGKMQFQLTSLQVQGEQDLRCSIYTPAPETATARKMRRLMEEKAVR
ncbi:helix-turn-helix transcriptional regulator [Paenibacillus pasadenensis]|uniref:helix-turn-helix transcriptional regulator n=1 Tax=Paenibacillus pasadenensis TaxID=217090 RepID=UPI00203C98E8|nr:helix-turn-helix transcriptional regulator [Paenibacillus pasadenensis]MCM3749914.1 helix-turn-helix transcriptional regulator [Paenibacillus pasadenensis]